MFTFAFHLNTGLTWIPLLKGMGMQDHYFGYMWSAMSVVGMIAPLASQVLMKKNKEKQFLAYAIALFALASIGIVVAKTLTAVLTIMFITVFFTRVQAPAERVFFHRFVPAKLRATIGSVESVGISAVTLIGMPVAGLLVDNIGPVKTLVISGVLAMPAAWILYRINDKKHFKHSKII